MDKEQKAIQQVLEKAYVEGIHRTQDQEMVRSGFHPDFHMLVLQDGAMAAVSLDEWFERIEDLKAGNPEMWAAETRCDYQKIDVTGTAAVAKLDVFKGDAFFSTDYMLLYRFPEGWRIVSKVFSVTK